MEFKDYYAILGVEPDAEKADIKAAYRRLARKYHPDLNPGEDAEEKFKEVAEAWEVLGDDTRRAEFDELRRYGSAGGGRGFEPPPGWQSRAGAGGHHFSGDFSDFFNSIFGADFESAGAGGGAPRGRRGQDVEIEMPVFLEETLADTQKPVEYALPVIENGRRVSRRKSLKVTIPAGVTEGERIRLRGQGVPGEGGAPDGDLYLHIRLVPHPLFDVQGHDLLVTVPLAPWEAALGARVTVPTLDGRVTVTVAPNSQAGRKLRIKGKGLVSKAGRGDLYAVLKVTMPTTSSDRARELWQSLSEELDFDARAEWRAST
ncbi:DnaJ C-terminal domain-containing protein [Parahaliea aestuarii]|uniref:DnaJ domain-containing protein n=1 Tax=Parahaliea aestuarii TaxID=1852021 RepID=A0A5C9A2C3_9GAMM|nr:DnaJ C-terminal domain-containing protein [Parahaliea aestuarii]TXS93491.1 DnaJ domain-containing protein [Parahaliea aestuarii]